MFNLLMRIVFDIDEEYKVYSFLFGYLFALGNFICSFDKEATFQTLVTMVVLTTVCLAYWLIQDLSFVCKFGKYPSILECGYKEISNYFWGITTDEEYTFMKTKLLISMIVTILAYGIVGTSLLLVVIKLI